MKYNIVIIGAGSAGLSAAYAGAFLKAKVALVEKHEMGGDCLNTGCVPSKALLKSCSVINQIKRHREFGIKNAQMDFDFEEVMLRVQGIIKKIQPHDSIEKYTELGVDCFQGEANVLSPKYVEVNGQVLKTKNIIIATGAEPLIPDILNMDKIDYYTTENIWQLRTKPKKLLIIGGGPVGCEFAQAFQRLGVDVTIVQRNNSLLAREDPEISEILKCRLEKEGVNILTGAKAVELIPHKGKKMLLVEKDGSTTQLEADEMLVAAGRKPRTQYFGLEQLDVAPKEGPIKVDAYGRTIRKNIFACGDVASPYQFTHTAAQAAAYCVINALFKPFKLKIDMKVVPWCTFTEPEIARAGMNEKEAKLKNVSYEVTTYDLSDLDRAITDGEASGILKVLTKPKTDKILGVTICGHHAGDILPEFVLAMNNNLGLNKIMRSIHVYPTMNEANKYAAGVWKNAHSKSFMFNFLSKLNFLRRI